jgi:hypothetical protein
LLRFLFWTYIVKLSVQPGNYMVKLKQFFREKILLIRGWSLFILSSTWKMNPYLGNDTFLLDHLVLITHFRAKPDDILGEHLAVQAALARLAQSEVVDEATIAATSVLQVVVTIFKSEHCMGLGENLIITNLLRTHDRPLLPCSQRQHCWCLVFPLC